MALLPKVDEFARELVTTMTGIAPTYKEELFILIVVAGNKQYQRYLCDHILSSCSWIQKACLYFLFNQVSDNLSIEQKNELESWDACLKQLRKSLEDLISCRSTDIKEIITLYEDIWTKLKAIKDLTVNPKFCDFSITRTTEPQRLYINNLALYVENVRDALDKHVWDSHNNYINTPLNFYGKSKYGV